MFFTAPAINDNMPSQDCRGGTIMFVDREQRREAIDRAVELHEWVRLLGKVLPADTLIDQVRSRFEKVSGRDKDALGFELNELLIRERRYEEALRLLDELIVLSPDNVFHLRAKASLYYYYLDDPDEALKWTDFALTRALRTRTWVRHVLANKARLLVELGRGEELGRVLEQIMSHEVQRDLPDIGRERDFVDGAPSGLIPPDILARYDKFCPKRVGDVAHEPPEFEEPEFGADGKEILVMRDR